MRYPSFREHLVLSLSFSAVFAAAGGAYLLSLSPEERQDLYQTTSQTCHRIKTSPLHVENPDGTVAGQKAAGLAMVVLGAAKIGCLGFEKFSLDFLPAP